MAVGSDFGGNNAVHYDDAVGSQHCQYLLHDLFEVPAVTADEYGVGRSVCCDLVATYTKITDMEADAWSTEAAGVLLNDSLALRANLEGFYLEMRELQAGLDADTTRAGTDVP